MTTNTLHNLVSPLRGILCIAAAIGIALMISACNLGKKQDAATTTGSGQTYEWRMATSWPPNFPILGEGCNMIAKLVDEMSNGQLKIKVYGGGELIPPLQVFDAVSSGSIELGHSCAYYNAGKIPESVFFTTIPFGLKGSSQTAWLLSDEGRKLWTEMYDPYNVVPFYAGNSDTQMGGWFRKEINSIDDYKGLKMRIPGLGGKVVSKAGGSAMNVAAGEIYTNLERGVIDATEWIGPSHDKTMGFDKVAKYYYYPGWHEPGTAFELMVNKEKLASLPPHLQKILETASLMVGNWIYSQFEKRNAETLATLKAEGVEIRRFPQPVLDQLRAYADEVIEEVTATNPKAKEIYESVSKMRDQMEDWESLKKIK